MNAGDKTAQGKKKAKKPARTGPGKPKTVRAASPSSAPGGKDFPVVGLGASAGGLKAFERFFSRASSRPNMAFILIPHLQPDHISHLPDLIRKFTGMKVVQAEDAMAVIPNQVYVIPPNQNMDFLNNRIHLSEQPAIPGPRAPINYFFHSLAEGAGERAVAIVLSGMGSDGSAALDSIKSHLGLVIAQDPASAVYRSMPESAIRTGLVDFILVPEDMPAKLLDYRRSAKTTILLRPRDKTAGDEDTLEKVFLILRSQTGHDFSAYKPTTVFRRLERRMNIHQIGSLTDYAAFLKQSPREVRSLFKELTIGVTSFFRDGETFEILKSRVLPRYLEAREDADIFRAWVPGCSTGEEAYSLAITLSEFRRESGRNFSIQVFATDINEEAIESARRGRFPGNIASAMGQERLERNFTSYDDHWQVRKEVREMLIFAPQNLIADPPFTRLDLISCRNLLIYLNGDLQKRILPLFHYALKPGGILILGPSESLGNSFDLFVPLDRKWKLFRKKDGRPVPHDHLRFPVGVAGEIRPLPPQTEERPFSHQIRRFLLDEYTPPGLLIDSRGEILYVHGKTGDFLEPAPGKAAFNLFEMARNGIGVLLPTLVKKAGAGEDEIVRRGLRVRKNGGFCSVDLTVRFLRRPRELEGLYLVLFSESLLPETPLAEISGGESEDREIRELREEVKSTRENLQSTIEELETANEELKSTNEEYQSTNEELKSANEELETSREEMQSLNVELNTVNSELQEKNEELDRERGEISNYIDAMDLPTLILDPKLKVKSFTSPMTRLINLIAADVGRPVADISTNLEYPHLIRDVQRTLEEEKKLETEVRTRDGDWYLLRINPYYSPGGIDGETLGGATVVLIDINQLRRTIEIIREPLLIMDETFKIIAANPIFYRLFGTEPPETEGRTLFELGNGQWDIPRLRELLEDILPKREILEDFRVEHDFPGMGKRVMLLNARQIKSEGLGLDRILLAIEDVTDRPAAEKTHPRSRK